MDLIMLGNMRRCVAPTGANKFSSRSHAILIFNIEGQEKVQNSKKQSRIHDEIKVIRSKLQVIDLAGSERASGTQNTGQRLIEGGNINKSLMALGQCINILAEQSKRNSTLGVTSRSRSNNVGMLGGQHGDNSGAYQSTPNSPKGAGSVQKRVHVPYRDSKLTRLLKDSLGGSTKTVMIACISQLTSCYEETMNTLKYASQAKSILNKKKKNEIILQEYSREYREEQMRKLAEIAEQERQERVRREEEELQRRVKEQEELMRLRREEELQRQIREAKIPSSSPGKKKKTGDQTKRSEIEVPQKLKREIEKISVINLGKLESKLAAAKGSSFISGNPAQRRQDLINLLQKDLIPSIVLQYNLRHQIQSNQILIDFQSQNAANGDQATSQNNQAALEQISKLQSNLVDAQTTQNKVQDQILQMFDSLEKQCLSAPISQAQQPPKQGPSDNLSAEIQAQKEQKLLEQNQMKQLQIKEQSDEIARLKQQLANQAEEIDRLRAEKEQAVRERKSTSKKKQKSKERMQQDVQEDIRNMEMIISDKNVEIDLIKKQCQAKEQEREAENQDLKKNNTRLKKMIQSLEKQVASQAQQIRAKDTAIEHLNSSQKKDGESVIPSGSVGPLNSFASYSTKPINSQLSKFTNKDKNQATFQKQKLSLAIENINKTDVDQAATRVNADGKLDDSYCQAEATGVSVKPLKSATSHNSQAHNSHLSKKQRTLKRYLSGVRVDSLDIKTVEQLNNKVSGGEKEKEITKVVVQSAASQQTPNQGADADEQTNRHFEFENTHIGRTLDARDNLDKISAKIGDDDQVLTMRTYKEQQNSHRLMPNGTASNDGEIQSLKIIQHQNQQMDSTRRRDLHQYPKLRQSVNNSKFQKNLQPRSTSRVSQSGGGINPRGSRSRSNLSRYGDLQRIKRSFTNVGFNGDTAVIHLQKNKNQAAQLQDYNQSQSILIPNASEIYMRQNKKKQPFKPADESDMIRVQMPRYGSQDESFTFQNDITERPSDIINQQLRPSFTKQNPFTVNSIVGAAGMPKTDPKEHENNNLINFYDNASSSNEMKFQTKNMQQNQNTMREMRNLLHSQEYNDVQVIHDSFQTQDNNNNEHDDSKNLRFGEESAPSRKSVHPRNFTSATSDFTNRPAVFNKVKMGSGSIPIKQIQPQQLSEALVQEPNLHHAIPTEFQMKNSHTTTNGVGFLNISTLSMEFQGLNSKRSTQPVKVAPQIGQGLTITSLEDQILDHEYENEKLRQLGFFGHENVSQSPQIAKHSSYHHGMLYNNTTGFVRGLTVQDRFQEAPTGALNPNQDLSSQSYRPDDRLFHLRSVQQLPLQSTDDFTETQNYQTGGMQSNGQKQGNIVDNSETAYQSRTSLPMDSQSNKKNVDFQLNLAAAADHEMHMSSKIVTPEPKHQHVIFKKQADLFTEQQALPSSARAHALGLIEQSKQLYSESRHSHTQSKADQHNIVKNKQQNYRELSVENRSIKSVFNLNNMAGRGATGSQEQSTVKSAAIQKNNFGQRFKEMLSLAEVRKVSKERRNNGHQFVKGLLGANIGKYQDIHQTQSSQREQANQILIVDPQNSKDPKNQVGLGTEEDCCSPMASADVGGGSDYGDEEHDASIQNKTEMNDRTESTSRKRMYQNLVTKNDVGPSRQNQHHQMLSCQNSTAKLQPLQQVTITKDRSTQRLQKFVDENNRKLEEILKMAEKIEMRSVESESDGGCRGQAKEKQRRDIRRSRSLRKHSPGTSFSPSGRLKSSPQKLTHHQKQQQQPKHHRDRLSADPLLITSIDNNNNKNPDNRFDCKSSDDSYDEDADNTIEQRMSRPLQKSGPKIQSPPRSAVKMDLAGPRSWAERGNLQASGGDQAEKQI